MQGTLFAPYSQPVEVVFRVYFVQEIALQHQEHISNRTQIDVKHYHVMKSDEVGPFFIKASGNRTREISFLLNERKI